MPGLVGVGGHLPAGEVDRLESGPHLLDRLAAGERAEGVDVVLLVELSPPPLGAAPGQGVLLADAAREPHHVLGRVGALDARPARIVGPPLLELLGRRRRVRLCHDRHRFHPSLVLPMSQAVVRCIGTLCLSMRCGRRTRPWAEAEQCCRTAGGNCLDGRNQGVNRASQLFPATVSGGPQHRL